MLIMHITGLVVGTATLTEEPRGRGRRASVPLYAAKVRAGDYVHNFGVTRCSSRRVFNTHPAKELYGWEDECPPNVTDLPYYAHQVQHAGTKTFALRLFEEPSPHRDTLQGIGPIRRNHMMIHIGDPACSYGCLTIGGGRSELDRLETFINTHQQVATELIEVHLAVRENPGRIP